MKEDFEKQIGREQRTWVDLVDGEEVPPDSSDITDDLVDGMETTSSTIFEEIDQLDMAAFEASLLSDLERQ
jgi:hypothetical protein